jgi:hypothetical protein
MAFEDDLRKFLESRLISFDPAIDLSANSPAQLKIITPTLQRFGQDPFSTDIPTFIRDRLIQEYPDMAADNAGMLEDLLSKPMQLLLEPFKREIQLVKIGSSLANASIMAESEAEALGANWFTDRDSGDFAGGPVRIFFAQPTTTRVSTDKRFFTNDGRSYFPVQNYGLTASQMAFNRQGSFYFLDVTVRAESTGDSFNVGPGDISGVEEVPGVVKVANLTSFITGDPAETNEEYISRVEGSLTDRSTAAKRGILARISNEFDNVRALQVVGAGDNGMDRDILTGTGQGFVHLAGQAVIFGDWLWISSIVYRDDGPTDSVTPQPGDTIRFHPTSPAPPATVVVEAKITTILSPGKLFFLDHSPYGNGDLRSGAFALLKPGIITISGVPGGIAANIEVPDNTVHLGGHTDVFARPNQDAEIQTTISNVTDDSPIAPITDLMVPTVNQNLVSSAASDFINLKVQDGDLLVIETGAGFAGTYRILEVVSANDLRVSSTFAISTVTPLRARIVRNIRLDLVSPKIPKLPFTNSPVSDLQTNVGSNELTFASINIQDYGAKLLDTVNILEGPDAGEYAIIKFGLVAGSVFVDRVLTATGANLNYEVYTKQSGIVRPLVRVKDIEVLDSTGQTTGITVPYGDAVDIRPDSSFEGAGQGKTTYDKRLLVFPDMFAEWGSGGLSNDFIGLGGVTNHTDARYTLGLAAADGIVRKVTHDASNQIQMTEINIPPFIYNGRRDKLIALVSEDDNNYSTSIPGTHKTSDIAEAKIGDSITIKDGPNQGQYIILDLRVLELWGKADTGHRKVALIQVDPPLKSDPIRTALDLINYANGLQFYTSNQLFGFLQYAADWDNGSGFYNTFITELRSSLGTLGITISTDAELKAIFDPLLRTSYVVGPSAKGTFRSYFLEPVSAEFNFSTDPTTFDLASDGSKKFRIDPGLPAAQILPESITPTLPSLWNRDLGVRYPQDVYAFLVSSPSLAVRGARAGDVLEVNPAINDLPARVNMTSSWMCVTQAGSNIVQLIMPTTLLTNEGPDNFSNLVAGQLFFLDSGPDAGAYVITKVLDNDWLSVPPVLRVQLDQPLTHTTENFPVLSTVGTPPAQVDFVSGLPGYVQGLLIGFPINLNGKNLEVDVSIDGGVSYTTVNHLFTNADPFNNISDVLADIYADATFIGSVTATNVGNTLVLTSQVDTPRSRVRISTSPTAPSAHSILGFTDGTEGKGIRGGATLPSTKKIYGSGMGSFQINDWITVYAANSVSILTDGEDAPVIGTYKVTAVGNDPTDIFWSPYDSYVEVDRTDNFPTDLPAAVRWIRHGAPSSDPANTVDGGKEISDQFVRFRIYDPVPKKLEITNIPWAGASTHPLLSNSDQQITLESPGIVDTGNNQTNYSHRSPFRIVRPDVLRVSSTAMALQREGALYYVDLPVIGYGPGSEMNVTPSDGFVLSGVRKIDGYTLEVEDEIFTYSTKEKVHLVLPNSVLPVGSTADLNNQFNLSGQNLQVTYNNAPIVEDLQAFLDSSLDRITAASMLVRHFLPAYVLLDAVYSGGSVEATVAAELINYINNINPDTAEIRTDLLKDAITRRGATTVDLPLTVIALIHGIDRRIRGMRSTRSIGIGDTPLFRGHFLQTYFIAGPDTSRDTVRPVGEQIFLRRT